MKHNQNDHKKLPNLSYAELLVCGKNHSASLDCDVERKEDKKVLTSKRPFIRLALVPAKMLGC